MDALTLEELANAIYAVGVLAGRAGRAGLEELGSKPSDVETLVQYAQAYWYQQTREERE